MALLEGNVNLVLAPHVAVRLDGPQHLSADDLVCYPSVEVSEESRDLLEHVLDGAIHTFARRVVDAERQVDAPPFRPGTWWLATFSEGGSDGEVAITSVPPSLFYGIEIAGRVHFLHREEVRVDDFMPLHVRTVQPRPRRTGELAGCSAESRSRCGAACRDCSKAASRYEALPTRTAVEHLL